MIVTAGATNVRGVLKIKGDSGNQLPETGIIAEDFFDDQAYAFNSNAVSVSSFDVQDSSLGSAFAVGNVAEIGNGLYRIDLPNSLFATASTIVYFWAQIDGVIVDCEPIIVLPAYASDLSNMITDSGTVTPQFTADSMAIGLSEINNSMIKKNVSHTYTNDDRQTSVDVTIT